MVSSCWTRGRVPNGFWQCEENRRAYMKWLGRRLGCRKPEDWYAVTISDFSRNHGAGFMIVCYNDSPLAAVSEYMPDYDWKPWLFTCAPNGFWQEKRNRKAYFDWLSEQLGYAKTSDWYGVDIDLLEEHHGLGLIQNYFGGSVIRALKEYRPRYEWKEWLFKCAPQGFWKEPDNRRRYMEWLGKRLGYVNPCDWYYLRKQDFHKHHGGGVFGGYFRNSVIAAVREHLPEYEWLEWMFTSTSQGFWKKTRNRRAYMDWLAAELGITKARDWVGITKRHFAENYGASLLAMYYRDSPSRAIRAYVGPEEWNKVMALRYD